MANEVVLSRASAGISLPPLGARAAPSASLTCQLLPKSPASSAAATVLCLELSTWLCLLIPFSGLSPSVISPTHEHFSSGPSSHAVPDLVGRAQLGEEGTCLEVPIAGVCVWDGYSGHTAWRCNWYYQLFEETCRHLKSVSSSARHTSPLCPSQPFSFSANISHLQQLRSNVVQTQLSACLKSLSTVSCCKPGAHCHLRPTSRCSHLACL